MDFTLISAAIGSIKAAKDIGTGLLAARDWGLVTEQIGRVNAELLKVQDALFAHNTQLLGLQQELLDTTHKLRKAEEALIEQQRYTLVDLGLGDLAYRIDAVPVLGGAGQPTGAQRTHYMCQQCLDRGRKVVLKFNSTWGTYRGWCAVCKGGVAAPDGSGR